MPLRLDLEVVERDRRQRVISPAHYVNQFFLSKTGVLRACLFSPSSQATMNAHLTVFPPEPLGLGRCIEADITPRLI